MLKLKQSMSQTEPECTLLSTPQAIDAQEWQQTRKTTIIYNKPKVKKAQYIKNAVARDYIILILYTLCCVRHQDLYFHWNHLLELLILPTTFRFQ